MKVARAGGGGSLGGRTRRDAIRGDETKRDGPLSGYGRGCPRTGPTGRAYRLYQALDLWDWFASIGDRSPLPGIAEDIHALSARH